jgi:hypothetical protein
VGKVLSQALDAFLGPLLTLGCTALVLRYLAGVGDEPAKAVGAAFAGLIGLAIAQVAEDLPRRSAWWRNRFDARAAFEGWWLQIHEDTDRVAVFSFLYDGESYRVEGTAFNSAGTALAAWSSTQMFFTSDAHTASYLWEGVAHDSAAAPKDRKGTTTMSVYRRGNRNAIGGRGQVQHLSLSRTLEFRLRRVSVTFLAELKVDGTPADLEDFERQRKLAIAYLSARS